MHVPQRWDGCAVSRLRGRNCCVTAQPRNLSLPSALRPPRSNSPDLNYDAHVGLGRADSAQAVRPTKNAERLCAAREPRTVCDGFRSWRGRSNAAHCTRDGAVYIADRGDPTHRNGVHPPRIIFDCERGEWWALVRCAPRHARSVRSTHRENAQRGPALACPIVAAPARVCRSWATECRGDPVVWFSCAGQRGQVDGGCGAPLWWNRWTTRRAGRNAGRRGYGSVKRGGFGLLRCRSHRLAVEEH